MHHNTAFVIAFLSVIAALLVGMNVGRKLAGWTNPPAPQTVAVNSSPVNIPVTASPVASPLNLTFQIGTSAGQVAAVSTKSYTSNFCGVRFDYPADYTVNEASNAARFTDKTTKQNLDMICGNDFPLPPLPQDQTATASVAGISAKVYHDYLAENNSQPIDVVIFRHPKNQLDIVLMGFGDAFQQLLKSLKLL